MPIYEYECNACGVQHEFIQKFSEAPKRKCPSCGKSRLRKLMSAAAFHLKGSGWYVTDFRDGDKKKPADDGDASAVPPVSATAETKTDGSSDSKSEAKADSKSAETPSDKAAGKSDDKSASKTEAKSADKSPAKAPAKTSKSKPAKR
ncbi:MAG: putative FmdB family regulatory protein [Gammaproteobacteria bacterium]|jgi:putative FmdB family regulatory protein